MIVGDMAYQHSNARIIATSTHIVPYRFNVARRQARDMDNVFGGSKSGVNTVTIDYEPRGSFLLVLLHQAQRRAHSSTELMTSIASFSCCCGKVQIKLTTRTPRVSTECCCNHCFARVQYLAGLGGPSVPEKPLLNSKWDNRVSIVNGGDCLYAFKLTHETQVINIASTCCHTFLLGRHSGYDANCVTTCSDFPIWNNVDLPFDASSRWFSNQWEPERLARYSSLVGIWVDESDGSIHGDTGWEEVLEKHMECMHREIQQDSQGETFDKLLDSIGRDKIVVVNNR